MAYQIRACMWLPLAVEDADALGVAPGPESPDHTGAVSGDDMPVYH